MITKESLENIHESRTILIREQDFAYVLPCDQLISFISNFTITFPNISIISDEYTIMPHGSVTLVLSKNQKGIDSFLFGPITKPIKIGNIANQKEVIFIVEFQPAGFFPFSKINQKELTDQVLDFSLINQTLDNTLRHIFTCALSVNELLQEIENTLISNIQFPYPLILKEAIHYIIQMEGSLTTLEISNSAAYSSRQFNRLFNVYLGMSIKAFSRLVRINKSFHLLNEKTNSLSFISEKLGYYDVSHFIKDFKIVCDITPQEYKSSMSDFYSEIAKF